MTIVPSKSAFDRALCIKHDCDLSVPGLKILLAAHGHTCVATLPFMFENGHTPPRLISFLLHSVY
jgi:hypothetical protein